MWDKVRKALYKACESLELLMVAAVICGIVVAVITLWPELLHYWNNRMSEGAFLKYLDAVFNVVIGIEFMKMLCRPNSANIIEVLIFLIARHMIVQTTTPLAILMRIRSHMCRIFLGRCAWRSPRNFGRRSSRRSNRLPGSAPSGRSRLRMESRRKKRKIDGDYAFISIQALKFEKSAI